MQNIAPQIELHALRGMGNLLRHAYDRIDPAIIFFTVVDRLPQLLDAVRSRVSD